MVEASKSEKGLDSIALGAKVLALVGLELITDPDQLNKVKEDHAYQVLHQ
jgi:hypothetical protein